MDDAELLELVELEIHELLDIYEFPGNDIPVQAGSTLLAIEAMVKNPNIKKGDNKWVDKIYALIDLVDNYIPKP